jgi:ABC-type transport system substrate-binding protein
MALTGSLCGTRRVGLAVANAKTDRAAKGPHQSSPSSEAIHPSPLDGVVDPDQQFHENYVCGAERNYTGYCSPEVDKLGDQQSMEPNQKKRNPLVWEIEKRLAEALSD